MNARLKQLVAQHGGMEAYKVDELAQLIGDDGVEQVITMAQRTEKSAADLRVAYKADAAPADDDPSGDVPPEVDDALFTAFDLLGDWQPIITAIQQLATPVKARVLTDSGKQSSFPTTKAFNPARDAFAVAVGADQTQRNRAPVATKSTPQTMKQLIETALSTMGDLH